VPRPTRLERWTLIAVLAVAMVYAVRSFVTPASPPPRLSKPAAPMAVSVVFLPAPVQAAPPAPPVSARQPEKPEPLMTPDTTASPARPLEVRPEPSAVPPVPLRPAAAVPAPAADPPVMPLAPARSDTTTVPPTPLRATGEQALASEPAVVPMMPGKAVETQVATAAPVPLRPRPPAPRPEGAPAAHTPVPLAVPPVAAPTSASPDLAPRPAPSAVPTGTTLDPSPRKDELAAGEGRALLRILEHGSGPTIDIAWPVSAGERERLYHQLKRCFGMRPALMDGGGRLYAADGRPGEPWAINLDRHSGFVRQARGQVTADERRDVGAIAAHHYGLADAAPVRVFPRAVDALLLGHLRLAVGDGYAQARVIRAAYRLGEAGVTVEGIEVDGRRVAGRIELAAAVTRGCRGGMTS
jgi:hypothetical protein